jgi:UDP-N-acetylglucosamine 2-epimerase (non-hydrolysing)
MSRMQSLSDVRPHIALIVGTRPEAIKLAPVALALRQRPEARTSIWCTGQHPVWASDILSCFSLEPDRVLDLRRTSPGLSQLCSAMMDALIPAMEAERPDVVVVQGDTSSAFAGALTASYCGLPVVHVEAGLRSGDRHLPFPEEAHRRSIANFSAMHCAPTQAAADILAAEGVAEHEIVLSGNTVIDALHHILGTLPEPDLAPPNRRMILLTCHRRESWGAPYRAICAAARQLARRGDCDIRFVVHPNPELMDVAHAMLDNETRVQLIPPLNYPDFMDLLRRATLVMTDSGGVQEEAAALGTPLLILRDTTERPEGVQVGTARLVGTDEKAIVRMANAILDDPETLNAMHVPCTLYGDGEAGQRIAQAILRRWPARASSPIRPDRENISMRV